MDHRLEGCEVPLKAEKIIKFLYLTDIIESINRIETYTRGIDYDSFCCNQMMFDPAVRNLEAAGEALGNHHKRIARNKTDDFASDSGEEDFT